MVACGTCTNRLSPKLTLAILVAGSRIEAECTAVAVAEAGRTAASLITEFAGPGAETAAAAD